MVEQDFGIFGFGSCKCTILLSHFYDYGLFVVARESCVDLLYQLPGTLRVAVDHFDFFELGPEPLHYCCCLGCFWSRLFGFLVIWLGGSFLV
jgi:hypothetical protein